MLNTPYAMYKNFITSNIIVLSILLFTMMPAQSSNNVASLKKKIESMVAGHKGTFAVVYKDLQSNTILCLNEREQFHAASTMKTPIMIEVFKQVHEKKISLDDSILVRNSFKSIVDSSEYSLSISDDSEDSLYSRLGKNETIRNLLFKMITVSSNLAANILIGIVGPDNITKTLQSMKVNDMRVLRGVEDSKAFEAGQNNTTAAYDLSLIFELIAKKESVTPESSEAMLKILFAQKYNDMIPAKLPKNVKVAHKTGSITNVQHDSGIVYLPDGRAYVLVILSKNLRSNKDGIDVIASISEEIYNFASR